MAGAGRVPLEASHTGYTIQEEGSDLSAQGTWRDRFAASFREIGFVTSQSGWLSQIARYFCPKEEYCLPCKREWKEGSAGLYLLVHGLNSDPCIFDGHIEVLKKKQPTFDIAVPYIPMKGNCSLTKAAGPIAKMARDYAKKNPGNPICIVGISNGGRVAAYVELFLRRYHQTPILVTTIAGALFGSMTMTRLQRKGLASRLYDAALIEELQYGSDFAKRLIDLMSQATLAFRKYIFYSTRQDTRVTPHTAAHPLLGIGALEQHFVVDGEEHSSLVGRVREHQLKRCILWMEEFSKKAAL